MKPGSVPPNIARAQAGLPPYPRDMSSHCPICGEYPRAEPVACDFNGVFTQYVQGQPYCRNEKNDAHQAAYAEHFERSRKS